MASPENDGQQEIKNRTGGHDQYTFNDMLVGKRKRNFGRVNLGIRLFTNHLDISTKWYG